MKQSTLHLLIVLSVAFGLTMCGTARTAIEKEGVAREVSQRVNDFDFTFKATYAYPAGFKSIYLSPYYDVKVSPDTVRAYLPYYGRTYVAPVNPAEGGIKFTSTDFDYQVNPGKKKGNWQVNIRTKDTGRELFLYFDVWENGTARLQVSDTNRQPISFQGDIVITSSLTP
ncbi:MAG: DUF4251 domain-containing protein [Petrimonas sp.]|uniref:DUF4251 domain-containing protein n=1 Tax=Petrimonas sp. TaxID=2023866 RepID=UPI002B3E6A64|nr:DUF4251 domain-containing protein [Petrimonas sp.]MEA5043218.1 DUF4251 domain-containing protein [Petrimonas sp.]